MLQAHCDHGAVHAATDQPELTSLHLEPVHLAEGVLEDIHVKQPHLQLKGFKARLSNL